LLRTSTFILGVLGAVASIAVLRPVAAQCGRPPVPRAGLAIEQRAVERVTYSDGVQTEGRLLVPTEPAPSCGWPLVVYVHSLGSQRDQDRAWQEQVAAQGFAVWAYDVRGQAAARGLSVAGTTLYGPTERYDLAEQIAHVRAAHAALVSPTRIAVIGDSQGGMHAWMAAAQSGKPLSVAGRGTLLFPEITCVVGADFVTEPTAHRVRGGTLFAAPFLDLCTIDPLTLPFQIDPGFASGVVQHFAAQDPAGLVAFLRGEPGRVVDDELATCAVPILFHHAWHDSICGVGPILDAVRRLPATTPFRLVASTVGHAVPRNDYELQLKRQLSMRWLSRFLWDERNGVDEEARFVLAWMPLDPQRHADPASLWEHAYVGEFPAPEAVPFRLYTDDRGGLSTSEPGGAGGTATRIEHLVAPGFDAQAWLADTALRGVAAVQQRIPMSERNFDTALTAALDLVGAPRVSLRIVPDAPRFAVCALLLAKPPGHAEFRMLSHWGVGVLDADPGIAQTVDFELSPIAVRLPAGTELRLNLRNHWVPEAPHLRGVVAVPLFDSYRLDIAHGDGIEASFVDLPVLNEPAVTLVASELTMDADAPGRTDFALDAGAARAGWSYLLVAGSSGQLPGIDLPGGRLPIRLDELTVAFAQSVGSAELIGFAGALDAAGRGLAVLDLTRIGPLPVSMVGRRLTFATWVHRSPVDFLGAPSNPVDLVIR
jgi:predicted acyl esterase